VAALALSVGVATASALPLLHGPHAHVCPAPSLGHARCGALVITDRGGKPHASTSPTGYGPTEFHSAYNLPTTAPVAQTIAIVDAYDDPRIASDLAAYSAHYGLPPCTTANGCFKKVNQNGVQGSYPKANNGWALEIALDVETAHAICQNCKILLVEAKTNSLANLEIAVGTAANLGATQISNSYGANEFSGETTHSSSYNHPGIAVTASSGEGGYGVSFPASSPYVVAVGGTTLNLDGGGSRASETVWDGAGSGCSAYLAAQSWQTARADWGSTGCGAKRGVADVAADADPVTGASVYNTQRRLVRNAPWQQVGGTSLSAPLIAGVYALAGNSASQNYAAAIPYANANSLFDVTQGSNGTCGTPMCNARGGYDGPTGLGTPSGLGGF
jgi:subtilase family serine protease